MWHRITPTGGQAKGETKDTSKAEGEEEEHRCGEFRNGDSAKIVPAGIKEQIHCTRNQRERRRVRRGRRQRGHGCNLGKVERCGRTDGEVLGFKRGNRKEAWISKETWNAIDERRKRKQRMEQAREQGAGYQVAAAEYKEQDKEVKKKCRAM